MIGDELSDRLLVFAVRCMKVAGSLPTTFAGKHIAGQLIRSSTSAGANYEECRGAESDADFSHKLRLVLKELRETGYWLKLICQAELLGMEKMCEIVTEAEQLARIMAKSLLTLQKRRTGRSAKD